MAIPWLPSELNFLAEEEIFVKISPHFASEKITFLSGTYGPFTANVRSRIPLWLALFLNSNGWCTLHAPKWLNMSCLQKLLAAEKENKTGLGKVPNYYMEVAFAFFTRSPGSIDFLDRVRSLVEDLWQ
jgi:GINS complex subunit 2